MSPKEEMRQKACHYIKQQLDVKLHALRFALAPEREPALMRRFEMEMERNPSHEGGGPDIIMLLALAALAPGGIDVLGEHYDASTERWCRIIVNGYPRLSAVTRISYKEVVELAYPDCKNLALTVTFHRAAGVKQQGTLTITDDPVEIKDGTIFDVVDTSNA